MANILRVIADKYQKTNTRIEQISLIFAIIAVAAFFINLNNRNSNQAILTDNISLNFACPLSETSNLITQNTDALKTNKQLALINFDTEIFETGLKKNEIPAITNPEVVKLENLQPCLGNDDDLLIVSLDGISRAYPKRILRFHLAINDTLGNNAILVTYSPLSNYFQVFKRELENEIYQFGISGLLYKNTDLLFDSLTESLWSPLNGKSLVGNMIGAKLEAIPFTIESFKSAIDKNPNLESVSFRTGFIRDYNDDPFLSYAAEDKEVVGKITYYTDDLTYKTQVIGFMIDNQVYALPYISESGLVTKNVTIENEKYSVVFNNKQLISFKDSKGNIINNQSMYWFVWFDFQPKTRLVQWD